MDGALHTLATGRYFEAPRWRDGHLWLAHEDLARGKSTSRVDMIRVAVPGAGHP